MKHILSIIVLTLVASFAVGQGVPPMPLPLPLPLPQLPQTLPQPIKPLTPTLPSLPPAPIPTPTKPMQPAQPAQPAPKPAKFVLASEKIADLTGRWRLTWGDNRNTLVLESTPTGITGTFYDSLPGDLVQVGCPVTGMFSGSLNGGPLYLEATCKDFSLMLRGLVELDGSEIQGNYVEAFQVLNVGSIRTGKFKMVFTTCMLPEGCKK